MVNVFPERREYFEALGEFIQNFADVENFLKLLCSVLAQTDEKTSEILFSGYSINNSILFVDALIKEDKYQNSEVVSLSLVQLKIITAKRNKIVHRGVQFRQDSMKVMNILGRSTTKSNENFQIETADIISMANDLQSIHQALTAFMMRVTREMPAVISSGFMPDSFIEPFERAARAPWQYIPLEQRKAHRTPTQKS